MTSKSELSAARRKLANPYAHIEELQLDAIDLDQGPSGLARIHASRMLLQDPYAYVDGDGELSAADQRGAIADPLPSLQLEAARSQLGRDRSTSDPMQSHDRLSKSSISSAVADVHKKIWSRRMELWFGEPPEDPIELLDPEMALGLFGYETQIEEGLGQMRLGPHRYEVAGILDRPRKSVRVSAQFSLRERRFTLAHELAHVVIHQHLRAVHRDRPVHSIGQVRERTEEEADRFAAEFLMPARLVSSRFKQQFGSSTLVLSDEACFALDGISLTEFLERYPSSREIATRIASVERFDGRSVSSLSAQFQVSVNAMAIRLEELRLLVVPK